MAAHSVSACCLAEFVGTFFLVLVTGCSVFCGFWAAAGPASVACALAALTFATGEISGGHLNPAVSLAACVSGRLPPLEAGAYVVSQAAGALLGAATYGALYSRTFVLGPVGHNDEPAAGLLELLYTFMLCLVFLNCDAQRQKGAQFTGAAVALVLVASSVAASPVSGGCLNPAAALAIDLTGRRLGLGASLSYVAHELVGAAAAGALVRVLRPAAAAGRAPERGGAVAAVAAEFTGTFLLAFTATLGALFGAAGEVWATAAALGALSLALADVSGAHFNPAVSLAVAACENVQRVGDKEGAARERLARAGAAVASQLTAAVLAAVVALGVNGWRVLPLLAMAPGWARQGLAEAACTALLVLTVLGTQSERAREPLWQFSGLAVGLAALAGGRAAHTLAGGTMSPALTTSVGIAGAYNLGGAVRLVGFELAGAALGGAALQLTHPPARAATGGRKLLPPLNSRG